MFVDWGDCLIMKPLVFLGQRVRMLCHSRLFRKLVTFLALVTATPVFGQTPVTFQYFYDETGQLVKVVDSTGVVIDYVYDEVGNMWEVKRSTITNPGGLQIFSFSPQQGGPLSLVTIQGLGFSLTPANNIVGFNAVASTVVSATATSLVVIVPVAATTGPISVTANGSTATSASSFTVLPAPAITSIFLKAALPNTKVNNVKSQVLTSPVRCSHLFQLSTQPPSRLTQSASIPLALQRS
jgi:YD repeat-containing protein